MTKAVWKFKLVLSTKRCGNTDNTHGAFPFWKLETPWTVSSFLAYRFAISKDRSPFLRLQTSLTCVLKQLWLGWRSNAFYNHWHDIQVRYLYSIRPLQKRSYTVTSALLRCSSLSCRLLYSQRFTFSHYAQINFQHIVLSRPHLSHSLWVHITSTLGSLNIALFFRPHY